MERTLRLWDIKDEKQGLSGCHGWWKGGDRQADRGEVMGAGWPDDDNEAMGSGPGKRGPCVRLAQGERLVAIGRY